MALVSQDVEEGASRMKYYLVACFDSSDAINTMQQTYLKMKIDFGEKPLSFNKKQKSIIGERFKIFFLTTQQIEVDGYQFDGVIRNRQFIRKANNTARNNYAMHLETTKAINGVNNRDGILRMYVEGGR